MIVQNILNELRQENLYIDLSPPGDFLSLGIRGRIQTDTRKLQSGDIFACIVGFAVDGHDFAEKAMQMGASLLIVERFCQLTIPQIRVSDSRKATAIVARLCYDDPTKRFELIGVTGTNGKTTTTHIIEKLLNSLNIKTGLIGTLGYKIGDTHYPLQHTTPDIIELNEIFTQMVAADCKVVVMEVSSHALALHRVYGLHFRQAIFTNLSQDHLDFHSDMSDYFQAKMTLFYMTQAENGVCIVNADDEYGRKILSLINGKRFSYSIETTSGDGAYISNAKLSQSGSVFDVNIGNTEYKGICSPLSGKFNLYNLLGSLVSVYQYCDDVQFMQAIANVSTLTPVPGRLQTVANDQDITIIVDYAHTPDALKNILRTVNEYKEKRLIAVWGCGGNRDKGKRHQMACISVELADLTIITTDNPRHENPADIIRDIIRSLYPTDPFYIISDRETAIRSAILLARPGDIVVLAGKGHETYQEIGDTRHHFDDTEMALKALHYKKTYEPVENKLAVPFDILNLEKILYNKMPYQQLQHNIPIFDAILTDSRVVGKNTLFIAIKGERFDGAEYVPDVLLSDSNNWCLVNDGKRSASIWDDGNRPASEMQNIIYTHEDPVVVYGLLAKKYLQLFSATKIAITGSTGKTTTKEILYNILSTVSSTHKSHENENNMIGVPKNIFAIQPTHNYAIFEIGTNQLGEIDYLANIVKPDYSLVVSINPTHLEGLGTLENVKREKLSILQHTQKRAFIPPNSSQPSALSKRMASIPKIHYTSQNDLEKGLQVTIDGTVYPTSIRIPFLEKNIAISIMLATELGISTEDIIAGLAKPLDIAGRMQILNSHGHTLICDYYNANPTSMAAAITYWAGLQPELPHIAILGELRELGKGEIDFHKEIGSLLDKVKKANTHIIGVGELTKYYHPDTVYPTVDELISSQELSHIKDPSVILIKGSHSVRLEKLRGEF